MCRKFGLRLRLLAVCAAIFILAVSCRMNLAEREPENPLAGTGSLVLESENAQVSRALNISELTYARAFVTGHGISSSISSD